MKRTLTFLMMTFGFAAMVNAQVFPESIDPGDFLPEEVILPQSPLSLQILFIGGVDTVQTRKGPAVAKQWHDFIGFTPHPQFLKGNPKGNGVLGWVSVNHERIQADDRIGDGGGMTTFLVRRLKNGQLAVMNQKLDDGREGRFMNVNFESVGETGMNCAGITSLADGRIWTAEEWFRYSTNSYYADGNGVRDTSDFTVKSDIEGNFDGMTINKVDNFNYMVEIDPVQAVAIRKQYNWGRQGFEGGVVMPDNKTVYLGEDARPGLFTRFIADVAGDFTKGTLSYYAWDEEGEYGYWVDYPNKDFADMLSMNAYNGPEFGVSPSASPTAGKPFQGENAAAMFNRNEWVAAHNGKVYWTETGNDSFWDEFAAFTPRGGGEYIGAPYNGKIARYWIDAAKMRFPALDSLSNDEIRDWLVAGRNFVDAHGRILCYDPETSDVTIYLEGGPYPGDDNSESAALGDGYPDKHLSNPDGLNFISPAGTDKTFMVINEDLNGSSYNRVPAGVGNRTCELYILDMDIPNPTIDDLIRISVVPLGAEVTGSQPTADGLTLLVNSQHPRSDNPFPYNNSLTYALNGWDKLVDFLEREPSVTSLRAVNASNERVITQPIEDGDEIDFFPWQLYNLGLVVETEPGITGSVVFEVTTPAGFTITTVDNNFPYSAFGDNGADDILGRQLKPGVYNVKATPYPKREAGGAPGETFEVSFTANRVTPPTATVAEEADLSTFTVYPNPVTRKLKTSKVTDIAIYNENGKRLRVVRNASTVDVSDLKAGVYYVQNREGNTLRFVVE